MSTIINRTTSVTVLTRVNDVTQVESNSSGATVIAGPARGAPGAPGAGGAGLLRHEHDQTSASSAWTINHNFGKRPFAIHIVDTSGDDVIGDTTHPTLNQTVINFSAAFAGKAYLGA